MENPFDTQGTTTESVLTSETEGIPCVTNEVFFYIWKFLRIQKSGDEMKYTFHFWLVNCH